MNRLSFCFQREPEAARRLRIFVPSLGFQKNKALNFCIVKNSESLIYFEIYMPISVL